MVMEQEEVINKLEQLLCIFDRIDGYLARNGTEDPMGAIECKGDD